jgi:hypothetical protein
VPRNQKHTFIKGILLGIFLYAFHHFFSRIDCVLFRKSKTSTSLGVIVHPLDSAWTDSGQRNLMRALVLELTRVDGKCQRILRWRQRARRKISERARWIESLIEIYLDTIGVRQADI